jgi:hypothetical protein
LGPPPVFSDVWGKDLREAILYVWQGKELLEKGSTMIGNKDAPIDGREKCNAPFEAQSTCSAHLLVRRSRLCRATAGRLLRRPRTKTCARKSGLLRFGMLVAAGKDGEVNSPLQGRAAPFCTSEVQGMPIFCLYAWYTPPG